MKDTQQARTLFFRTLVIGAALLCAAGVAAWSGPTTSPPGGTISISGGVLTRICVLTPNSNSCGSNGTYSPTPGSYLLVEVWGAGGGGAGGGNGTVGSAGTKTCFGTNSSACTSPIVSATAGAGAVYSGAGGGGMGACTDATNCLTLQGSAGNSVLTMSATGSYLYIFGGNGGAAPRGGGSGGGGADTWFSPNSNNGTPFGGGGSGGGIYYTTTSYWPGAGGGSGGYAQKLVPTPASTYYYTIGAGGAGGSSGGCGGTCTSYNGGTGGAGGIVVYEYSLGGPGSGGSSAGVSQITAGNGISISPTSGTGNVTLSTGLPTIAFASANGPADGTDIGQIASRVLTFTKNLSSSNIRIEYSDNLRTYSPDGGGYACRWQIKIDGQSCTQPLIYDIYGSGAQLDEALKATTVLGYCRGISAGTHTIQVWVGNTPGYSGSDCYTGWSGQTWTLEAQESN